jgi:hypothetical protein
LNRYDIVRRTIISVRDLYDIVRRFDESIRYRYDIVQISDGEVNVLQDCVAFIPPYPFYIDDPDDFDLLSDFDKVWYGRLQLLMRCTLCPTGQKYAKDGGPGAIVADLAFISTFEPLPNAPVGITQKAGCDILVQPRRVPTLYFNFVRNTVGRVPMFPCFLNGNTSPTIPYSRRTMNNAAMGIVADSRPDSGNGSLIFEVNMWMWRFGRSMPRRVPVAEAQARRTAALKARAVRGAATRKRRREAAANRDGAQ